VGPQRQATDLVVAPHDTLWGLAAAHLGSPYRWRQLFDLNRGRPEPGGKLVDPNLIYAGWTLQVPAGAARSSAGTAPPSNTDAVYVVQPGDTLWGLAAAHLGSPYRWRQLFDLNRGRVEPGGHLVDPNLICAGWTLEFPAGATGVSSETGSTEGVVAHGVENRPSHPVASVLAVEGGLVRSVDHTSPAVGGWWN
jgi:nucleoid-associated protein YgaU